MRISDWSSDVCSSDLVDLLNASGGVGSNQICGGDRSGIFVGGGLPPPPVITTVPIDGKLRTIFIGAVQKAGGTSSIVWAQRIKPLLASQRPQIFWSNNLDAQHKATSDKRSVGKKSSMM